MLKRYSELYLGSLSRILYSLEIRDQKGNMPIDTNSTQVYKEHNTHTQHTNATSGKIGRDPVRGRLVALSTCKIQR